jgi:predicted GTPase
MNYQLQNKYVQDLFTKAEKCAQSHQRSDLARSIDTIREQLSNQKLSVVVCGEFKRGKSSLINALVGVNKLCPVALSITTNLVTEVTYGEVEKITVVMYTRKGEERKEITREQIADYVTEKGNPNNQKQVQSLIIEIPSPLLADGLVLIDTPGIGGVNGKHTIVTKESLKFADVILFVSDTSRPLLQPDLDFIQNNIGDRISHTLFVVTRLDEVGREKCEPIVTSNRKKISELSGRSLETIPIVPVSSRMKLSYLDSGNEEHLAESNFAELEQALWETIDLYRTEIVLGNALGKLIDLVAQIKLPILAEKVTYEQNSQEKVASYLSQIEELENKLNDLLGNDSSWQRELSEGMDDLVEELEALSDQGFGRIFNGAYQYVSENVDLTNTYLITQPVNRDITILAESLFKNLSERSTILVENLKESTELSLNQAKLRQIFYLSPTPQISSIVISKKSDEELRRMASEIAQNSDNLQQEAFIGGLVGGGIGLAISLVLPIPGLAQAGITIGANIAGNNALSAATEQELAKLKAADTEAGRKLQVEAAVQLVRQFVADARESLEVSLKKSIEQLSTSINKDLMKQINQEQKTCTKMISSLQDTTSRSQAEMTQGVIELNQKIALIEQLQQEIIDLSTSLKL